jgi:glycosyltransferase involved in cell wall biosynthesis
MHHAPAISVVMPVYNTPVAYLREAVESILQQEFTDFEFLIIDDGSTSTETLLFLKELKNPRITQHIFEKNQGVAAARNEGIDRASGTYIMFMDSDDVALPARLSKAHAAMENHPEVSVCIVQRENFFDDGRKSITKGPEGHEAIANKMLFFNQCVTSSVMFRGATIREHGIKIPLLTYGEDYVFAYMCAKYGKYHYVHETLTRYRQHADSTTSKALKEERHPIIEAYHMILPQILGGRVSEREVIAHVDLCRFMKGFSLKRYINLWAWVCRLLVNKKTTWWQKKKVVFYFFWKNVDLTKAVLSKTLRKAGIIKQPKNE